MIELSKNIKKQILISEDIRLFLQKSAVISCLINNESKEIRIFLKDGAIREFYYDTVILEESNLDYDDIVFLINLLNFEKIKDIFIRFYIKMQKNGIDSFQILRKFKKLGLKIPGDFSVEEGAT